MLTAQDNEMQGVKSLAQCLAHPFSSSFSSSLLYSVGLCSFLSSASSVKPVMDS